MSYRKTVVCLANSRKPYGRCFAGKEVLNEGFGGWIRPVSAREGEEISVEEQRFANGNYPKLLDMVTISLLESKPTHHQQENHLIHTGNGVPPWEKAGSVGTHKLPQLVDSVSGDLWINGNSSSNGVNDRVSVADARKFNHSLLLIQPTSLNIIIQWGNYTGHRQVRADFNYNGSNYNLVVTDEVAEEKYREKAYSDYCKDGQDLPREYHVAVDDVYLCVSLLAGEPGGGISKLVAAIIGGED